MIETHLIDYIVSKEIPFAVANGKYVKFTLDQKHDFSGTSTYICDLRKFLIKLVIQLKQCSIHQDFDHFVEIPGFIQHWSPFPDLMQQIVPEEFHTLGPAMPIKHREQTDEFPFTTSDILLNQQTILHFCSCASI